MLQVTSNGPWGKDVHSAVPVSVEELMVDLGGCLQAGADGVHLHVRDQSGVETLDPAVVNGTCTRVRDLAASIGAQVEIGLTTGAWIVPDLDERIAMVREWEGVECATVNVSEDGFDRVMAALIAVGIGVDVGLWAPMEMDRLLTCGLLPEAKRVSIELDPGEPYFLQGEPVQLAQQLNDALDAAGSSCPRLTHGMNDWTWTLVRDAFERGHDTRVGFEDSTLLPDGTTADSNADLVRAAVALRNSSAC